MKVLLYSYYEQHWLRSWYCCSFTLVMSKCLGEGERKGIWPVKGHASEIPIGSLGNLGPILSPMMISRIMCWLNKTESSSNNNVFMLVLQIH